MDEFYEETFREICHLNGVHASHCDKIFKTLKKLKLFYNGISRLVELQVFTNLKELVIIGQPIAELKDLTGCKHLQLLWICECELQSMQYVDVFTNLRDLCLFDNKIETIRGLKNLVCLSKLNLSDNYLSSMSNLHTLVNLRELNVAGNRIQRIDSALSSNINLIKLNISGNFFYDLSDMLSLASLPHLEKLNLSDPEYQPNSIASNPQTCAAILHYMPGIADFDNLPVDLPSLRNLFRTIVCDKKQFYFSLYRHKLNEFLRIAFHLHALKKLFLRKISSYMEKLDCELRLLRSSNASFFDCSSSTYIAKIDALKLRIMNWKRHLMSLHLEYENCININCSRAALRRCIIACELQLFGNLSITEGNKSDEWFRRCEKFCLSHFCTHVPLFSKYSDFAVCAVFKIFNAPLYNRFTQKNTAKTFSNDLFFACTDFSSSKLCSLSDIVHGGFSSLNSKEPIILSLLLNSFLKEKNNDSNSVQTKTYFRFLIVRANLSALFTEFNELPDLDPNTNPLNVELCNCFYSSNPLVYKVGSPDDVYPEFIVELECSVPKSSNFHFTDYLNCSSSCLVEYDIFESNFGEDCAADRLALDLPPKINPNGKNFNSPSLATLHNQFLQQSNISTVSELNLHGTSLVSLPFLKQFPCLTSLTLSCCNLQDLCDLNGLTLQALDVSHNNLTSLSSITQLCELLSLDASWNKMVCLEKEIAHIHKHLPKLFNLKVEFNPWLRTSGLQRRISSIFPNLEFINGSRAETFQNRTEISTESFMKSHLFTEQKEFWLSLWPVYLSTSRSPSTVMNAFPYSVMQLIHFFDGIPIYSVNLDRISPLQLVYLSLNNTNLSDISIFSSFTNVEELSVENNSLLSLSGIQNFCNLKTLLASGNFICNLSSSELCNLKKLQILALDCNKLTRIDALASCVSLKQLYLSSNRLNNFQSLQLLRSLNELGVLDLRFNPIVKNLNNYRLRFVYHIPSLYTLDGRNVNLNEISTAKDMLEGKLTVEYLATELGHNNFYRLVHFNNECKGLHMVDLDPPNYFTRLRSVNLEGNNLTSFSGLLFLETLEVLCLNGNKIECLFPKATQFDNFDINQLKSRKEPLLPNLKVLSLANNGIISLQALQLFQFLSLNTLFLQGNQLSTVDGLDGLRRLRDLVLDNNKIRKLTSSSFAFNCSLQELHIENNRLKDLPTLPHLAYLERIYLGGNKLEEIDNLVSCLSSLQNIKHVNLIDNPLAKKFSHRWVLSFHLPRLLSIDGMDVNDEERQIMGHLVSDQQYFGYLDTKINSSKPTWPDTATSVFHADSQPKATKKTKPAKLFPVANVTVPLAINVTPSLNDCVDPIAKQNIHPMKRGKTGIFRDMGDLESDSLAMESGVAISFMRNIGQKLSSRKKVHSKVMKEETLPRNIFISGFKPSSVPITNSSQFPKRLVRNNGALRKRLALPGISVLAAADLFTHLPPLDFESTKSSKDSLN